MQGAAAVVIASEENLAAADRGVRRALPDARRQRRQVAIFLAATQYLVVVGGLAWLIYRGGAAMQYQWQWARIPPLVVSVTPTGWAFGPLLLGLVHTLRLAAIAGALSLIVAVALALGRLSSSWTATKFAAVVVSVARNTPLIVQVSMFYFVLAPVLGVGRFWSGVASLVLFESAFVSEIVRSGILSVPAGQWEAGAALGLHQSAVLARVVAPQALRTMLPSLTNAAISLIKDTSIVSVIALFELTTAGRNAISDTYMSFEIWLTVAAIYLALTLSLSLLAARLEKRLTRPFQGHLRTKRT